MSRQCRSSAKLLNAAHDSLQQRVAAVSRQQKLRELGHCLFGRRGLGVRGFPLPCRLGAQHRSMKGTSHSQQDRARVFHCNGVVACFKLASHSHFYQKEQTMVKPLSEQLADLSVRAKSTEDAWAAAQKEAHDKIAARKAQSRAAFPGRNPKTTA